MIFSYMTGSSLVVPIYTRIAIDVAAIRIRHVRVNQNDTFVDTIDSRLNRCFEFSANLDQTGRNLIQEAVQTLFDKGVCAIVPIDLTANPRETGGWDVRTMRVGTIIEWYPRHVKVEVYNERTGLRENLILEKREVAIVQNPFYPIMNELNSLLRRLLRKLSLLDVVDEQSGSGKLDLIIQLPYMIKGERREKEAETRRLRLEQQMKGSQYGVGYIDGTERITQLNRPAENNLLAQVELLTSMLKSQLGMTDSVFDGTASEDEMMNYNARSLEPVLSALVDEMQRKFLTMTARTQRQRLMFFPNVFRLVPATKIGDLADRLTRNEIASPNEIRALIGFRPSDDRRSD